MSANIISTVTIESTQGHSLTLGYSMTNTTDTPLYICTYDIPLNCSSHWLKIVDTSNNQECVYFGPSASRVWPPSKESFLKLGPQETVQASYQPVYGLKQGHTYTLNLRKPKVPLFVVRSLDGDLSKHDFSVTVEHIGLPVTITMQ